MGQGAVKRPRKALPRTADLGNGANTVLSPSATTKKLRIHAAQLSVNGTNSAEVTVSLSWGSGAAFWKGNLLDAGTQVAAKEVNEFYWEGAAGEALIATLSAAQPVTINYEYEEV